ncbi:MAG: cadherin domain-containing protein, partial [Sulfuricurvum sp.]
YSVVLQSDGQIVVTGTATTGNFALARYNSDGSLDTTFGTMSTTLNANTTYTEATPAVVMDSSVILTDPEFAHIDNYDGSTLTLSRNTGADTHDQFCGAGIVATQSSGSVIISSLNIGTYTYSGGTLIITFNASATQTLMNQTLSSLEYQYSGNTPPSSVQIGWTFSDGALSTTANITINLIDVYDGPIFTSNATPPSINENSGAGQVIYTASATDTTAITYSLKNSGDASHFSINSTSGAVSLIANPDYEAKNSYTFTVNATDTDGNVTEQNVNVSINDLDDIAPTFISTTAETTTADVTTSTVIYDANATDVNSITYSFAGGFDDSSFTIDSATGYVRFNTLPDYNAPIDSGNNNIYDFIVRATDSMGNHADQNIALTVTPAYVSPAGQSVISLGTYGNLIAPVQVDGKWYYVWDMNGDGVNNIDQNTNGMYAEDGSIANSSGSGYQYDYTTHDLLDQLLSHDSNRIVNITDQNMDGNYGTTDEYRYGTIGGVKVALATSGVTVPLEDIFLTDAGIYTDLAAIWDSYNSGDMSNGTPNGWEIAPYWSATENSTGNHTTNYFYNGMVMDVYDDSYTGMVALQVL